MQLWHSVLQLSLLASAAIPTAAASAWGFTDATVSVNTKGAGVGAGVKETQKDLPVQFLSASEPLEARFLIGSFGESTAYNAAAFQLDVTRNADEPVPTVEVSRYGKLPEIHHIFKSDPQSPPIVITLAFVAMVLATLPVLGGVWLFLGVNVNHLPTALKSAPIPHIVFLGSLLSIEGIFFLYYSSWTLFQILPAVAVAGSVAFVSGSRALGEVQGRRLAGLR
ncbi:oligosaccharyltransferase subunit ribophorin II [Aspergillus luchuensis]|uniref:Oligosaccharyltransferase subunit ribophorin II n=1 Tax=Aspergillus kawachii TaxID=1069201 RepID=A0A146FIG7_ASPKA|nr:oligosaccharyltransferase subunit ribophorin II [Aspergillus luchuensis]